MLNYPAKELENLEKKYTFHSDDIYYYGAHRPAVLVNRLKRRTEEFNVNLIPEVFLKALNEKVISYEVSSYFGTGHVIVFVKTKSGKGLVLRATHAMEEPEKYIDMEKEVIDMYKNVGVPSTEIIFSDATRQNFPFEYEIMLPLEGKDLEIEWAGSQGDYDSLSFELGRMLARQYQLEGEGWGRWKRNDNGEIMGAKLSHHDYLTAYLDHDLDVLELFALISSTDRHKLEEYFSSPNLRSLFSDSIKSYFVHHDVADHNIRYIKRKIVALYDWENAVLFDPISDIGSAPTWKTHYPREQLLRNGFLAEIGYKPDNFEVKADVYFLRTMLWKLQLALKGQRLSIRHLELFTDAMRRNGIDIKLNTDIVG